MGHQKLAAGPATIKTAFERNAEAVSLRPGAGRSTESTTVRLTDGTACEIEDGPFRLAADAGEAFGGDGTGPSTNALGRAALGACIALGASIWAAKLDVPIEDLDVEVQTDLDAGGFLDVAERPPGWEGIRYRVRAVSPAPEAEVRRMLEIADRKSPIGDCLRRPLDVERSVEIVPA